MVALVVLLMPLLLSLLAKAGLCRFLRVTLITDILRRTERSNWSHAQPKVMSWDFEWFCVLQLHFPAHWQAVPDTPLIALDDEIQI